MIFGYWMLENGIFPTYFVPLYIGLVLEMWASSIFLLVPFHRKKLFPVRLISCSIATIGIAIGLGFLRNLASDSVILQMGCAFLLYGAILGTLFISFEEHPIDLLLVWVSIMAIRESADCVDTIVKLLASVPNRTLGYIDGAGFLVNGLIFDGIHLAVQLGLGFLFNKHKSSHKDNNVIMSTVLLSLFMMFVTIVIKAVMISHSGESVYLYGSAVTLALLASIFVLILRTDLLIDSQKSREIAMMNGVMQTQQKQFEESKQSIALINARVHDIKHRIDDFGDKVAQETLDELKSSIGIYDRPFHTGSQVLDTILYTKSLECDSLGIRITAIGDASPLHFIPSNERFYFFSNILDNAIEATRDIENAEKRVIGIALRNEAETFYVEEYNYFEGARELRNGNLQTTKKDAKHHGLGLKSIRYFAEEHGGTMSIRIDEDMFFLTVTIPLKK